MLKFGNFRHWIHNIHANQSLHASHLTIRAQYAITLMQWRALAMTFIMIEDIIYYHLDVLKPYGI